MPNLSCTLAPGVSAEQTANRFAEHTEGYREMFVAEVEGEVVGTVSVDANRCTGIGSLRVFALDVGLAFRRMGVGTALMKVAEGAALSRRVGQVKLEVALENSDAVRLYTGLGYRRLGDPFTNRWTRIAEDGSNEKVEELSWVMVKEIQPAAQE